jgi:TonB-linked SusC/RagA family outer membrane protein
MRKIITLFLMTFIMSLISTPLKAQSIVVRGSVFDSETKEPLIGVNVYVLGTNGGTISNSAGKFTLNVSSVQGLRLQFTYLGYEKKEVTLGNENTFIEVALNEQSNLMDEVVVVGYSTQKKESVVGAIAAINNKELVKVPVANISQALAGKLAGVQIVQPSGEVGRDEAEIYVRGLPTYNDASPLILVDGIVRQSFSQIDPNEIESVSVLKDASATAVFGVKGANGVIIVTTRRGNTGKLNVSFSANYSITQPQRIPNPLHAYETASLINVQRYAQMKNDDYSALDLAKYRTASSPYTHPDVNWVNEIMKDFSSMQQYNLNISGGNSFVKYFVSGGYLTQDGFYKHDPYTDFTRYNFRSNMDFDITKRLKAAFNLGARIEKRQFPGESRDNSWNIYRGAFATGGRHYPVYNPDGSLAGPATSAFNLIGVIGEQGVYKDTKSVVEMGLNVRYDLNFILDGLSARGQLAFDNTGSNSAYWQKSYSTKHYSIKNDMEEYVTQGEDSYLRYGWEGSWFDQKVYGEAGLEYVKIFDNHSVTGLFLANRDERQIANFISYADQGLVGRVTYDFDKRYFAEFNMGFNGSENFAKGKRYDFFPALALGWTVSNESFIAGNPDLARALTHLKIRGSYGVVGNGKVGDITSGDTQQKRFIYLQQYYNGGGTAFGSSNNWFSGIYQGNIANENVTWETGVKSNIGFEANLFNELFRLNLDLFYEKRSDIITDIGGIIPDYTGKGFMHANVGVVENKGLEMEFSHRKKIGKDFSYRVKGVFSFTRNKVLKEADPLGLLPYQKAEGYSIGTSLLYKSIGVFQDYEDIANSPSQLGLSGVTEVKPGDTKYLDFNNDGIINEADAFRQGYGTVPEIQYGLTLGITIKNIEISALLQGSEHSQFLKNWEIMWPFSNGDNAYAKHWRYWTPEISGQEQHIRFYNGWSNNEPTGGRNSYTIGSGDYIRLKNIEVAYNLPEKWISKLKMTSAKVYVTGNNVFLWADEPYLDPDNRDERGGRMPQTRAFNFGLNVNF